MIELFIKKSPPCLAPGFLVEKAIIITLPEDFPHRVEVKFLDLSNVQGTNMVWWCSIYDIELDREWYREMKLKEIGIIWLRNGIELGI